MRVGILAYELRHGKNLAAIPLRRLLWPSQDADTGKPVGCIGDLSANDHVVLIHLPHGLYVVLVV